MDELQLVSCQQPGVISGDNFLDIKDALAEVLARKGSIVYPEDCLKAANGDAPAEITEIGAVRVEQPETHRAWCDAQANAAVYFKLKELK